MIIGKAVIPGKCSEEAPIPDDVNDATWEQISKVSVAGTGDTYWDIGDCKAVTLNGQIGDYLTLTNETLYVFILDFNHPINKTTADNNIVWGGFKTALTGGKDVALCDNGYNSEKTNGLYFNLNHKTYMNYGGWKGCDFRYDILGATSTAPSSYNVSKSLETVGYDATQAAISNPKENTLMDVFPNDLRSVLRLWNRYVDYKGNSSNSDANCSTPTIDAISLLAEYEIFGTKTNAGNSYEQNHQKQMAYYSVGNSKIKYKHNATGTACQWWESTVGTGFRVFCEVGSSGSQTTEWSDYVIGLAPAFRT